MCALIGREGAGLQPIALKGTPRWVLMSREIGPIARRSGPLNGLWAVAEGGKGGGEVERERELRRGDVCVCVCLGLGAGGGRLWGLWALKSQLFCTHTRTLPGARTNTRTPTHAVSHGT